MDHMLSFLSTPTRGLLHEMVGAGAVALFFFLWAWLVLGTDFVHLAHRTFRRQEPSSTDLKIAKGVGYMCIFFGSAALLQGLINYLRGL